LQRQMIGMAKETHLKITTKAYQRAHVERALITDRIPMDW